MENAFLSDEAIYIVVLQTTHWIFQVAQPPSHHRQEVFRHSRGLFPPKSPSRSSSEIIITIILTIILRDCFQPPDCPGQPRRLPPERHDLRQLSQAARLLYQGITRICRIVFYLIICFRLSCWRSWGWLPRRDNTASISPRRQTIIDVKIRDLRLGEFVISESSVRIVILDTIQCEVGGDGPVVIQGIFYCTEF